jgi:uncharacterized protein (DUF983 family)
MQPADESTRPSITTLLARAIRLSCPGCGRADMFHGPFAMHELCPACGRRHNRGPGFFLGSIYFNYGVTAALVVGIYFTCFFLELATSRQLLFGLLAFSAVFPLWFFRYARALWAAFDEYFDPTVKD